MARQGETLTLTLPVDPDLVLLTRLVSSHFFRQNGLTAAAARRGARVVERRCRTLLVAAARKERGGRAAFIVFLRPRPSTLEVFGRTHGGSETCLIRLSRPDPA
jgi:hypothetical protein